MEPAFTILDHTADVGLRVRGATLAELFGNAARGMFTLLCDPTTVHPRERVAVAIEEDDLAYLLHDWLKELLYIVDTRRMLFARFEADITAGRLDGAAWGEPLEPARHEIKTEIKAVTCHGLEVRRRHGHWTAQVIFDL